MTASESGAAGEPSKPSKGTKVWRYVTVIVVVVVVLVVVVAILSNRNNFTAWHENQVIVSHYHPPRGTETATHVNNWNDTGFYLAGRQVTITVPFHVAPGTNGTLNVTRVECNTPGFSLASTSVSLPITLSNDPSVISSVTFTFNAPSTAYTGPFGFTEYFDWYPQT
ncbi:MAG TPA: hypothetical protein VMB46_06175 [Methanomassiliicoccales archaeon]|nr:hypothetical protein [Methanomassiliicoccales archaeon]